MKHFKKGHVYEQKHDDTKISLGMQVINEYNWPERSLSYLCRSFDNLKAGEEYLGVKPAIQISILNFTLFPEFPEFYATYCIFRLNGTASPR